MRRISGLLLVLWISTFAVAQSDRGIITGTVTDQTGAVVAGATGCESTGAGDSGMLLSAAFGVSATGGSGRITASDASGWLALAPFRARGSVIGVPFRFVVNHGGPHVT